MGRTNRARRAAKQRERVRTRQRERAGPSTPPSTRLVEDVWAAVKARHQPGDVARRRVVTVLEDAATYRPVVEHQLAMVVRRTWDRGWLPYDLVRYGARRLGAAGAGMFATLVVDEAQRQGPASPMPGWARSVAMAEAFTVERLGEAGDIGIVEGLEVLAWAVGLPRLATLAPPTGRPQSSSGPRGDQHVDERQLERVMALLAKAESTTFPEEAEALTAKAQELIARHSLEQALRSAANRSGSRPGGIRVWHDDPYADAKAQLLARVARANRCSCVWGSDLGCSTLFGYSHDLDAVELLHASLLAQATSAMNHHGAVRDSDGRSRTRSFRRSFLLGFAGRIGERLMAATAGQEREMAAACGDSLLPVLASRVAEVEAAVSAAFPHLQRRSVSISNGVGWRAGRQAADLAHLGPDVDALDRGHARPA